MTSHAILAVIPARGGSKSVPRKNVRVLDGRPLIAHSIEQALASKRITRVIVSTDDREIAEVASRCGAEVPFMRPAELAEDSTPDHPVFQHALDWLAEREAYVPEAIVHLRPTAPIRRVATIDRAIELFLARPDVDSLRAVSRAKQTPYKMWFIGAHDCLDPVMRLPSGQEAYNLPRQALRPAYWQNGYIDVTRPRVIAAGSMTGTRILSFVITERCIEIDYEDHFEEAERVLQLPDESPPDDADRFPS